VGRYNQFVGSLETQVMTQAKRLEDLKVDHEGRELPDLSPVETAVRPFSKLSTVEIGDDSGAVPALTLKGRSLTS
jgi:DNA recombination protein RmuC